MPGNERRESGDIHIALEGVGTGDFDSCRRDELFDRSPVARDVRPCGGEVVVHWHDRTRCHQRLREDVFTGAALVCGQKIRQAKNLLQFVFQTRVGGTAGIAVVGNQHRCLLLVAHGIDTAIGEHVHENVLVLQQESIVACRADGGETLLHGRKMQLLHNAHLVHLQWELLVAKKFDLGHTISDRV